MKKLLGVLVLFAVCFCQIGMAAPLGGGMLYSEDHRNDPSIRAIRNVLLTATPIGMRGEQLSFTDEPFDFLKKTDNQYYVRIGDDFVFVGDTDDPDQIYVSPLFHGNPGTVKLFRHFQRGDRNTYLFSYDYTTDGQTRPEYFALYMSPQKTWCTDMIDFQQWDDEGTSHPTSPGRTLRDVRCIDVDGDGGLEVLCTIEKKSATGSTQRDLYISKMQWSDKVSYYEYRGWKPTFQEIFRRQKSE